MLKSARSFCGTCCTLFGPFVPYLVCPSSFSPQLPATACSKGLGYDCKEKTIGKNHPEKPLCREGEESCKVVNLAWLGADAPHDIVESHGDMKCTSSPFRDGWQGCIVALTHARHANVSESIDQPIVYSADRQACK